MKAWPVRSERLGKHKVKRTHEKDLAGNDDANALLSCYPEAFNATPVRCDERIRNMFAEAERRSSKDEEDVNSQEAAAARGQGMNRSHHTSAPIPAHETHQLMVRSLSSLARPTFHHTLSPASRAKKSLSRWTESVDSSEETRKTDR